MTRPLVHSRDFQQALTEIWPAKPRITWRPPAQVDYGRLEAMFSRTDATSTAPREAPSHQALASPSATAGPGMLTLRLFLEPGTRLRALRDDSNVPSLAQCPPFGSWQSHLWRS
jgi:hypothetical protein